MLRLANTVCFSPGGACALEQVLPVKVIWAVGWPAAAIQAGWQLVFAGPTLRELDRLPAALRPSLSRPSFALYLWRERTHVNLAKLMCLWPDRLCSARWADRCRRAGFETLEQEVARSRPVVLALLHFGLQPLLVHWLRALGMPAAGLRERRSAERPLHLRYIDRLTARPDACDLPIVFDLTELRGMLAHLRAGRIVAVAVEGRHVRHIRLDGDGFTFRMASGPLRIAAASGAVVIPCLLAAGPRMSFIAHFGEPVPRELVADPEQHHAACDHLLRELLAVVRRYPGQSHSVLIRNLERLGESSRLATARLPEAAN